VETLVCKFGGTSVATRERIAAVAERIADAAAGGDRLAVVVSARGDATDRLIEEAEHTASRPNPRELDMLMSTGETASAALVAMAVSAHGPEAVALSGIQAGVATDGVYGRGRIERLDPTRVRQELDAGRIPIVAGFQGLGPDGHMVTLGRGQRDGGGVGSAAALRADRCEIYTDVEGVYTADPRCVPLAHKLDAIGYGEMLEMAQLGAKVMQHRSVGIAQRFRLPVVVRSSFTDTLGTSMMSAEAVEIESVALVRGVAHDSDVARITVRGVRDRPGLAHSIFQPLADQGINIDVIVQNVSDAGTTDISFTVSKADMATAVDLVRPIAAEIGAGEVSADGSLGKVGIVGVGIQSTPGIAARAFGALADGGINILGITTSEIRITCLVDEAEVENAARTLHTAFGLDADAAQ